IGGAEPVGRVRGEDAGLEHPDREHRREPRALGVLLVVVDRVEVARRALVPHEVPACERTQVARLGLPALREGIRSPPARPPLSPPPPRARCRPGGGGPLPRPRPPPPRRGPPPGCPRPSPPPPAPLPSRRCPRRGWGGWVWRGGRGGGGETQPRPRR